MEIAAERLLGLNCRNFFTENVAESDFVGYTDSKKR